MQNRYKMVRYLWTNPRPAIPFKAIYCVTYRCPHYAFLFKSFYDIFYFFFIGKQWLSTFFHIPSLSFADSITASGLVLWFVSLVSQTAEKKPIQTQNSFLSRQDSVSLSNGSV